MRCTASKQREERLHRDSVLCSTDWTAISASCINTPVTILLFIERSSCKSLLFHICQLFAVHSVCWHIDVVFNVPDVHSAPRSEKNVKNIFVGGGFMVRPRYNRIRVTLERIISR